MDGKIYRVIYSSHTSALFNRSSLAAIIKVARRNNAASDVTGLLVYHAGRFFQVLEGDEAVLSHRMARIAADPRHQGLAMVEHGPVQQRAFNNWRVYCALEDAVLVKEAGASPLRGLIPANSDLRGNDPGVRQRVRAFLAGLQDLPAVAAG